MATVPVERKRFYEWMTLAGVMLTYAGMCGDLTYAYGLFLPSMAEAYHWSRSVLSGPYAVFVIIGGLLGPVAGMTVARFGARRNIVICNIIAALGLLSMSRADSIWHVYFFFGILGGIGIAFAEFIPLTTIINHWFVKKRSLAMGMLFASGGVGGLIMPPVISWFILEIGWRHAWLYLGGIHVVLAVVMSGVLIRNKPEDLGWIPEQYGVSAAGTSSPGLKRREVYQTITDWTLRDALHTPSLWYIVALFAIVLFVLNLLTTHQVAYLQDLNFSPMASSTALGIMLGMSIIGRVLCGALGMRYEGRHLAIFFMAAMAMGVMALMNAVNVYFIYMYSILAGIGFGGMIVLIPNLMGAYFGRLHYSKIIGWTAPIITLVSAVSPVLAGYLYDVTGAYFISFILTAALLFGGIIIAYLARPPRIVEVRKPNVQV